ncbi:MAG: hypothetical protein AB198_01300 [Parcubacteria bacterium C7867-003]|nr:MAG: hypothetical protein AB198_01300 [Parcubacteria bacterium C7867-003]
MNEFLNNMDGASKSRLSKAVLWTVILLAVFLGVQVLTSLKNLSYIGKGVYPSNVIAVNGTGEVLAVPDIASFSFSVVEEGKTVKQAQDKATQKINSILEAVKGMGIEDKDIKTTGYNSYPKYDYQQTVCTMQYPSYCPPGKQVLTGYEVSQSITVKVRNTEKAGDVLTKVGELGAGNISGLDFVVDDLEAVKAEAREKAVADAKAKAKVLAKTLGVRLDTVVNFYESGDFQPPVMYAMDSKVMGMGAANEASRVAPSIPTGENKIVSNVTITYEVK